MIRLMGNTIRDNEQSDLIRKYQIMSKLLCIFQCFALQVLQYFICISKDLHSLGEFWETNFTYILFALTRTRRILEVTSKGS